MSKSGVSTTRNPKSSKNLSDAARADLEILVNIEAKLSDVVNALTTNDLLTVGNEGLVEIINDAKKALQATRNEIQSYNVTIVKR